MDNNYITGSFNLISIIIVIIMYFIVIQKYINSDKTVENFNMNESTIRHNNLFKYKASNARIMYNNTGELPWNRHIINSSIPYDIDIKPEAQNVYYYEFDNKTYTENLKKVFKNNCEEIIIAVEGNEWTNWINPKTLDDEIMKSKLVFHYNKILEIITTSLNEDGTMDLPGYDEKQEIQVVHDIMLRYRTSIKNSNYFMFDIDMILYRSGKFQGKHVKLFAVSNGFTVNIIMVKVIGVIAEDKIVLHPYRAYDIMNKNNFNQYVPMKYGTVDSDVKTSQENTFEVNDDYMNSEIENLLYKKLLEENIPEDIDVSNNNYIPQPGEIIERDRCNF
tara:strand:- start:1675 stop:2673 length:999 start_codon:yes stop_codon:yes gene_type:complete